MPINLSNMTFGIANQLHNFIDRLIGKTCNHFDKSK